MNSPAAGRILVLMFRQPAVCSSSGASIRCLVRAVFCLLVTSLTLTGGSSVKAVVLWSDLGQTLAHDNGAGNDILGGAVKRDDTSSDTLYFKFHVEPLSDVGTEEYFAGFQLFEGDAERLGVGNSLKAWAYSVFNAAETGPSNKVSGDLDLSTARPESSAPGVFLPYELPRRGIERTIVFKVKYVPGGDDQVTVWLDPDLAPGATEAGQAPELTTKFAANGSFDQIRLRHGGGGGGWTFSDMEIATSFNDFVAPGNLESAAENPAGGAKAQALTFRLWQREEGLPQNSVQALAQTHDGYLWIGGDNGVSRFDGVRFVSFGLREGLRTGSVRTLFEDSRHALWIGTANEGLTRWENGQFTTFTTQNGLPSDSVMSLAEDSQGRLWVGTSAGLVIGSDGHFSPPSGTNDFDGRPIPALFKDAKGEMWVGATGAGVFHHTNNTFAPLTSPSWSGLLEDPHSLLVDKAGRIWIGAGDDFVLCRDGDQWRSYRLSRHLTRSYVKTLVEEPDGTVWAGSVSEGLIRFKAGKLEHVDAKSGLSDDAVQALLVDREDNVWVGTAAGLNRLRNSNLTVFGQNEGLGYGPVQGLAEVSPGTIWAGKPGDGLYSWAGRSFRRLNEADISQRKPEIITLLEAHDGSCWVGGGRGLGQFKEPKTSTEEIEIAALAGLNVLCLAEDKDGNVWAGTREGQVWCEQQGNWAVQTNYSQQHPVTAIAQDKAGAMWIGTQNGGLYRIKGEGRTHLGKGGRLLSDNVRTLYVDAAGVVWIGTVGGGLTWWHNEELSTLTDKEGLPDNTISQIVEDDSGRLWLGSNHGLACVSKHDLAEYAAGKMHSVYPILFGRAEGMPSEECSGGFNPAGLKTKSGQLWFPTMKGIVAIEPRSQTSDTPPPTVLLEETLVDGIAVNAPSTNQSLTETAVGNATNAAVVTTEPPSKQAPSGRNRYGQKEETAATLRIPPGRHRLEFHYTGISLSTPERVRFRYRLEGLDTDWTEGTPERTAPYNYVPPGQYHFQVMACTSGGNWNEAKASLILIVLPHYWQDWRFIVLSSLALLALVGGIARLVEKRKHQRRLKELEQERAIERERARIAQDLHDDLGSSLTRISLLSDLARADKDHPNQVEVHAQKISQSAGQTVRALEEIVWALRPGSDSLQGLVDYIAHFANELFEGDGAKCRLDLPHDLPARSLPPEMRHNIFLIVKEALTNALKHSGAREVRVQAKMAGDRLEILVQDDGRGFRPADGNGATQRHGQGNMRRRAEAIGGTLVTESAAGSGTSVRLSVNLPATIPA